MTDKFHSCAELIEYINKVGLLPLLRLVSSLNWSAEQVVDEDCQYVTLPDGGWEWSLLTTPEDLFGKEACHPHRTPEESRERLMEHFRKILPGVSDTFFEEMLDKNS